MIMEYRRVKVDAKKKVKIAVKNYELSLAEKAKKNPKLVYKYMNSKKINRGNIMAMKDEGGKIVEDKIEVVKILNNQFKSVFVRDNGVVPNLETSVNNVNMMFNLNECVSGSSILRVLNNLSVNKSCGADGVRAVVLKNAAEGFLEPLKIIFRKSLLSGDIPREWKEANISPIYKDGSKMDPANYRPVSLTSIVSKILESLIREEILRHLVANRLISSAQHGFVPKRSCVSNLLETVDYISFNINYGGQVDMIYLDFSKLLIRSRMRS